MRVTFEGQTLTEVVAQMRAFLGSIKAQPFEAQGQLSAFPEAGPESPQRMCPEHGKSLVYRSGGTSRDGHPYKSGFRCPEFGCKTFVAAPEEAVA